MARLVVDQADDPRIADYRNVPDPVLLAEQGLFVAEGRLVVRRLLTNKRFRTKSVMVTEAALAALQGVTGSDRITEPEGGLTPPVYVVPQAVMNGITGFNMHRGCLAIGERGTPLPLTDIAALSTRLLLLERVANPDNVGGLFRNAAAFGVGGVVLDTVTTDPLYRKAIRTSVGATLDIPFARAAEWESTLHAIADGGFTLVALTPSSDATPLADVAQSLHHSRVALVVGHEGEGLAETTMARCPVRARIPMTARVDSLNVAVAAAIALYELQS